MEGPRRLANRDERTAHGCRASVKLAPANVQLGSVHSEEHELGVAILQRVEL